MQWEQWPTNWKSTACSQDTAQRTFRLIVPKTNCMGSSPLVAEAGVPQSRLHPVVVPKYNPCPECRLVFAGLKITLWFSFTHIYLLYSLCTWFWAVLQSKHNINVATKKQLMDLASRIHWDILQSPGPFSSLWLGLIFADTRELVDAQVIKTVSGKSWSPLIWCSQNGSSWDSPPESAPTHCYLLADEW